MDSAAVLQRNGAQSDRVETSSFRTGKSFEHKSAHEYRFTFISLTLHRFFTLFKTFAQGASEVVSNDVALTHEKRLMILTGPNMGGKSTYLRSAAVAIILAQMGSFVPAEGSDIINDLS